MLRTLSQVSASSRSHYVQVETPKPDSQPTTSSDGDELSPSLQLTLEWQSLRLAVKERDASTGQVVDKVLLNNVSGQVRPGELLAIMGPSGAGKSTLLDCISGRNTNVDGRVTVNKQPWSSSTHRVASYIHQDDLFIATITVREHLLYQARLRIAGYDDTVINTRVNEVMDEFGLAQRGDDLIGDGGAGKIAGLSGGERKRLSLASVMLTKPSILFADEPTSGIDSSMAESIVGLLRRVASSDGGRTVVATIHQPSSQLFAQFDQLYLLSEGSVVYRGAASAAIDHFASLGLSCPRDVNPADYFMTQLVVIDKDQDTAGVARLQRLKDAWQHLESSGNIATTTAASTNENRAFLDIEYSPQTNGLLHQTTVLTARNFMRIRRDPFKSRTGVCQSLFVAWLVGSLFYQLRVDNQRAIQNVSGMLFFIVINQTFTAAIPAFSSVAVERPLLLREHASRSYSLLAWYLAKNLSEFPFQVVLPSVFFIPAYFATDIGDNFTSFMQMLVIVILVNSAAIGLGYLVSCLFRRGDIAPIIGVASVLPFLLFGGLLINSNNVPSYYVWLQYASPVKYGFEGLMKTFWSRVHHEIPCAVGTSCRARTGQQVLAYYGMESRSVLGDAWLLVLINVTFRILAYFALVWTTRRKQV